MKHAGEESTHHNSWARSEVRDISRDFEHFLSLENRWILRRLPALKDRRVLDIGCGLGEASLFFARAGAHVTAVDISEGMIEHCIAAVRREGLDVEGVVAAAEDIELEEKAYDVVYAANVLHHLERPRDVIKKVSRALRPDGIAFFIEPLRYNPVINVYRRIASDVRTKDERPVGFEMLDWMRESFEEVRYSCTWLFSLIIFLKYYLIDGIHPNEDRYWKRILREPETTRRWMGPLVKMDEILCRICPPLKYLCWNIVISASRPMQRLSR